MLALKKISKDLLVGIIASLISALILAVISYGFGMWPYAHKAAVWLWTIISTTAAIPRWLLIVGIPALLVAIPVATFFTPKKGPKYVQYKKDNIFGIDWFWKWNPPNRNQSEYKLNDLLPRCPKCKSILSINDYDHRLVYCVTDSCRWSWPMASCRYHPSHERDVIDHSSRLYERVRKEIDRRIQTGEWKRS